MKISVNTGIDNVDFNVSMAASAEPVIVRVYKEHQIAQARQAATGVAQSLGFSPPAAACLATAVTELASNLFFHAQNGGAITLIVIKDGKNVGIQVVSEDAGPGIEDVPLAMQDGYTTRGGMGGGLPGTRRLMDDFEITSKPGAGTRIVATKWMRWT